MSERKSLPVSVVDLMRSKVDPICAGSRPMRDLVELGEMLKETLSPQDRIVVSTLLSKMAENLCRAGDERNVKAYLQKLSDDL